MALLQHPGPLLPLLASALLLFGVKRIDSRSSPISDLKSKISGVEELLEEFRKQLQQDQAHRAGDVIDSCVGDFNAVGERIIRARASIEQGATFLLAPERVYTWKDCLHACCSQPHCTVALVQEERRQPGDTISCYLFNCTYRGKNVCSFAPQQGFTTYSRSPNITQGHLPAQAGGPARRPGEEEDDTQQDADEPPRSDAGQDVVIQLPTDWAVLDGRDSVDDHGINHFEWTLVKGDTAINMKATHPGLLKISGLQEGVYTFQMTVTDTAGQKSSDNVSVTVLAPKHQAEVCTGHCSNYQFKCDDGCCIDITYACDGKQHCPDRSDEDFCPNFDSNRKSVTHPVELPSLQQPVAQTEEAKEDSVLPRKALTPPADRSNSAPLQRPSEQEDSVSQDPCAAAPVVGPCKGIFPRWYYDQNAGECKHFLYGGCQGNHNNFLQESDCVSECIQKSPAFRPASVAPPVTKQTEIAAPKESQKQAESDTISKPFPVMGGHPGPESGAILPLALGLIITALLLLMIGCRLRLVRHKLKKARPLTTEESDYLINGMYL
ncbi:low-density lipoprotein receptor-related protein 11-like [Parambassis ranga]|uniref:Low-density lipoprotein receptor-related protein 11-like n=1 Tax=Parambassis ranga TaxID=210632 RepID=A0A6P7HAV3_9TELE|nr:low-density lipoprotein receptor-related protein 11-like [Parambassis ranga]XP_028252551.1 low-density lipoprotein receptor-related protein 11-like [Parambassis ranga]